jgi:hypothetical protein
MQYRRKVLIVVAAAMLILAFLGLGEHQYLFLELKHQYFLPLFLLTFLLHCSVLAVWVGIDCLRVSIKHIHIFVAFIR